MKVIRTEEGATILDGERDEIERYLTRDEIRSIFLRQVEPHLTKPDTHDDDEGGWTPLVPPIQGVASGEGKKERIYRLFERKSDNSFKAEVLHSDAHTERMHFGSTNDPLSRISKLISAASSFGSHANFTRTALLRATGDKWWLVNDRRKKSGMELMKALQIVEVASPDPRITPVQYRRVDAQERQGNLKTLTSWNPVTDK